MKKTIILMLAALACSAAVMAQNLDPTVEVSREYEGKLIEVHKPAIQMAVPDTLYRFDLSFDYSVFDNPYKGAYEFNPYILEMKPASSVSDGNDFYLRAGAGYTLHPFLDMLWSPVNASGFDVNVYAMHRSYIGEYRGLNRDVWKGYDMFSKAGADFSYDWKKTSLDFGAAYYGIHDKDYRRSRGFNALDVYAGLKSDGLRKQGPVYDARVSYRFAQDDCPALSALSLSAHEADLDFQVRPAFAFKGEMVFDFGAGLDAYKGAIAATAGSFNLTPRYVYKKGRLGLDCGLRISAVFASGDIWLSKKQQYIYPDLMAELAVIPEAMKLYAHIGGGERFNNYSSLLAGNHHLDLSYSIAQKHFLMDVTVENIAATIGVEGRITNFFSYHLKGGYRRLNNDLLDVAVPGADNIYMPAVAYSSYQNFFASLDWNLTLTSMKFIGNIEYTNVWGLRSDNIVAPAPLKGEVSLEYDWMKRINVGADCQFALSRSARNGFVVPSYADLGIYAEYAVNRKLSLWIRGGNLLNMEIQKNLLYAEKGINFTAGVCLTF